MTLSENQFRSACRGCHGGCVHILTVEDGKVTKVIPDTDSPLNLGKACVKGMTIIEQMYHKDRITTPMKRIGPKGSGQWEPITWDEAYTTIATKVKGLQEEYGKECITTLTGTGRHLMSYYWRFSHLLGTPNGTSSGPFICLGPRNRSGQVTAGSFAGTDYFGPTRPKGILVWGGNPAISGADGELQWKIKDAVKEGIPLIVVDVHPTELTRAAKLWLRPRVGSDGLLALGILRIIIEEELYDKEFVEQYSYGFEAFKERCLSYDLAEVVEKTQVPLAQIQEAAHLISSIKPLGLEWGCAIEQTTNTIQTCRSIFCMMGLTGNFDVPGGFTANMDILSPIGIKKEAVSEESYKIGLYGGLKFPEADGMGHTCAVIDAMKEGQAPYKIRGLLAFANNPLLSLPNSQLVYDRLMELEFMVCMDFFLTPSAQLADIFLPAALWPEIDNIFCMPEFAEQAALCMQKVVQVGNCKSDQQVFADICKYMGIEYGPESLEEMLEGQLKQMGERRPEYAGITFDDFKKLGYIEPQRTYYNYKTKGFNTLSGKFEFYSQGLEAIGGDPLPFWQETAECTSTDPELLAKYPLTLTTGARQQQYFISNNRQIRSLRRQAPFPLVTMHPSTGEKYGIAEGDWVWISTQRGRITQKAKFVEDMNPTVINCQMGWWYPEEKNPHHGWRESNANVLTMSTAPYDPYYGSYQLRGLLCAIEKNEGCTIEARYEKWMAEEE